MKKKHKIVMLPSNKADHSLILRNGRVEHYRGYLTQDYLTNVLNGSSYNLYVLSDDTFTKGDWCVREYYPSNGGFTREVQQFKNNVDYTGSLAFKKIIATTDKLLLSKTIVDKDEIGNIYNHLYLPRLSQDFIKSYISSFNAGSPITEVEVEMEIVYTDTIVGTGDGEYQERYKTIKINPDNTISISPVKDTFTREEVIDVILKFKSDLMNQKIRFNMNKTESDSQKLNEWIKENL